MWDLKRITADKFNEVTPHQRRQVIKMVENIFIKLALALLTGGDGSIGIVR
jgi:hypothetical protein